ncbi:hypothetical protein [Mucilaginibacter sp. L196]|uniref:hypothetical protein n=1 Tax=Mucilaginibacter sp. L196 TaxID=1641870 RepID=UPI00131C066E|nr:hypothetical protein [Mucilaginibacter sp. L196]
MYKRLFFYLFSFPIFLLSVPVARAQQAAWQWSVLVNHTQHEEVPSRAYLWIPADCKQVKAVIFAQNNMEEQSILENTNFRKAMARLGVAEIWVSPAYDLMFNFDKGAGDVFNGIMNDLADVSGYTELRYIPFIGMGHSAAASSPYYMAAWNPDRALAAISVSGQWPYFRHPAFAPDIWGKQTIDFIPCLETMGEYEAANNWSAEGLRERQQHPLMPLSMLASPAQGHFAATDEKCAYIALYIKKAIQYRIPVHTSSNEAPKLIPVDPTKTGWLVDKWRYDQKPEAPAGSVSRYLGDPKQAFWFFDKEMAEATVKYEATHRFQQPQLIGYVQSGKMVAQHDTHQQVNLKFEPEADGITFKLHASFYYTVGDGSPRLAMWANMPAGSTIGHASGGGPIVINRITGPMIKVNDSTFRLNPQRGFWQDQHSYELWFAATHPGDKSYKPAVQQAQMLVPPRNKDGREQHITFLPIADQQPGAKNIKLQAVSDAKVPVFFYVQDGPAAIQGNTLDLTNIPPKSKFPVKVTVVAWQYGNSREPKLQTAEPVERVFWINK